MRRFPILTAAALLAAALNSIAAVRLDGEAFYFSIEELFQQGIPLKDFGTYVTYHYNGEIDQEDRAKEYELKPKYTFEGERIKRARDAQYLPWKGSYYESGIFYITSSGWYPNWKGIGYVRTVHGEVLPERICIHVANKMLGISDQTYVAKNKEFLFERFLRPTLVITAKQIRYLRHDSPALNVVKESSRFPESSLQGLFFRLERDSLLFPFSEDPIVQALLIKGGHTPRNILRKSQKSRPSTTPRGSG
jgi:hypothetical protein